MGGRKCSICAHPKRRFIERRMLSGKHSERAIAEHFGVSSNAIHRHKAHIERAVTTAKANGAIQDGKSAYEQFQEMVGEAEKKYRRSKGSVQVAWFREWRGMLELAFKLGLAAKAAGESEEYRDVSPAVAALIAGLTAEPDEG